MSLKEEFEQYAEKATVGDVNTDRPGLFDPKGKAKWDAWKANEGKSQDDAMSNYITKAKQLLEAAGLSA